MSRISPCYKCESRQMKCHATCEKYLAYRKEKDKEMALREEKSLLWRPDFKKR